ncbi:MAG: DUF2336 domain-containing protein [Magnetovibrionaceae bacterium]
MDSSYLLNLAREKSAESRNLLAETITDLFHGGGTALTERERALMFDILRKVIKDAERTVRRSVSELLADKLDAPAELVQVLGNDEIEVAYPILTQSDVLKDESLIEVIRTRTLEHQLAISLREEVSEAVSDSLVATGNTKVIKSLLDNPSAQISGKTMEYLVEESKRVDTFQEPILNRGDLEPHLAKRMFLWVSAALRKHIVDNLGLEQEQVDDLLEQAAIKGAAELEQEATSRSKSEELAEELGSDRTVTPELLISALESGEVRLFIALFKKMTDLRQKLIWRMVLEPGGEGLAIVCRAADFSSQEFSDVFYLTRKARPGAKLASEKEVRKALAFFDRVGNDDAREVVKRWRRNSDYLSALRSIELG